MQPHQPLAGLQMTGNQKLILVAALVIVFLLLTIGIHAAFKDNTPGIDFYVYWQSGRAFFLEGLDPYSDEVSIQIQYGIFHGRESLPGEDPMKFNYPPFALIPCLPFIFLPFQWAQAAWLSFNIMMIFSLTYLAFPKAPVWVITLLPFFYQSVFGLVLGNLTILIFSFLLFSLARIASNEKQSNGTWALIGILLAWSSIKPQFVWLFIALALVVSLKNKNYTLLLSYLISLCLFSVSMLLIQSNWIAAWLGHVQDFTTYHPSRACREFYLGIFFQGDSLQTASNLLMGISVPVFAAALYLWSRKKIPWIIMFSWGALTAQIFHPVCISYDQLILVLPIIFWAASQPARSKTLIVFWLANWAVPYVGFILSKLYDISWAVNQFPIILYLIWLIWLNIAFFISRPQHSLKGANQ